MEKFTGLIPEQFTRGHAFMTRQERAARYCEELSLHDAQSAREICDELTRGGQALANTVVVIPVAAGQEADLIAHTVSEYARQKSSGPFTLVLGLNSPSGEAESSLVIKTRSEVELAKRTFPKLDLRSAFVAYDEPIIGQIRRDLWNAVALASVENNSFSKSEVIGINHDIDLVRLSPHYIKKVQEHYAWRDGRHIVSPISPANGSITNHAYSQKHPNSSKAVLWNDFYFHEMDVAYEAGIIIPLSLYVEHGGFSGSARTHEVGGLTSLARRAPKLLAGTYMETSPRRYLARINEHGFNIWSADSFTAKDECREPIQFPDISKSRKIEVIRENLASYAANLAVAAINRGCDEIDKIYETDGRGIKVAVMDYVNRSVKLTENRSARVLDRIVGSSELAKEIRQAIRQSVTSTLTPEDSSDIESAY